MGLGLQASKKCGVVVVILSGVRDNVSDAFFIKVTPQQMLTKVYVRYLANKRS